MQMRALALVLLAGALSGCSLATAIALAPIIGEIAKPIVEGVIIGIEEANKPQPVPAP